MDNSWRHFSTILSQNMSGCDGSYPGIFWIANVLGEWEYRDLLRQKVRNALNIHDVALPRLISLSFGLTIQELFRMQLFLVPFSPGVTIKQNFRAIKAHLRFGEQWAPLSSCEVAHDARKEGSLCEEKNQGNCLSTAFFLLSCKSQENKKQKRLGFLELILKVIPCSNWYFLF